MGGIREFSTALLGYDRREVATFSEDMDAMVDELRARIAELEQELETMRREKPITANQAFANVARETQRILQSAQEAGARMLKESREQAQSELAHARRERAQIVGDGYRARDEMGAQLRELAQARVALMRRLEEATAEVERVCATLVSDDDQPGEPRRVVERARTGTETSRPSAPGTLRVVSSDEGPHGRPARPRPLRPDRPDRPDAPDHGDPVLSKRDQLAPLRAALTERLTDKLGGLRDTLRERIRHLSDAGEHAGAFDIDDALIAAVAEAGATHLRQAFELGAGAAAARTDLQPATAGDAGTGALHDVLVERVGAPIRALLVEAEAADDPPWVLVERIDGIIADASAAIVAPVVDGQLSAAYERGKLATWTGGGVTARRWIVSPRGHRSDEPCRANVRAGAVDLDTPFPSGDQAPPHGDGCTCTTDVANEESDP